MIAERERPLVAVRSGTGGISSFCKSGTPTGSIRNTARCIAAESLREEAVASAACHSRDKKWREYANRSRTTYQATSTAFRRMAQHIVAQCSVQAIGDIYPCNRVSPAFASPAIARASVGDAFSDSGLSRRMPSFAAYSLNAISTSYRIST